MAVDFNALKAVCNVMHEKMAFDVFGAQGTGAVYEIMEVLWKIYRQIEPELLTKPIVVFREVNSTNGGYVLNGAEQIADFTLLKEWASTGFVLKVASDATCQIAPLNQVSLPELAKVAVVYEYAQGGERFLAGDREAGVIKLDPTAKSQFSIPTFTTLRAVLKNYAQESVRYSSCPVLSEIWADKNRVFLKPKPEEQMRRSLTWFLKVRLAAGHEVRPEQIMDESHPVDIKVTQMNSNRLAIIEIKWLGDSRDQAGKITVQHRDKRAKDGADQLAGYLDMNLTQAPLHITKGYYVLIDARRRGLRDDTEAGQLSRADGYHYQSADIEFDPRWHDNRTDFEVPFRMFAEPLCASH